MKSVIMRTPETDRKKVEIPTLLTDLTDYADGICTGKMLITYITDDTPDYNGICIAGGTAAFGVGDAVTGTPSTQVYSNETNVTEATSGFVVTVPGTFMVTFYVQFGTALPPMGGGCVAPPESERQVFLMVNGSPVAVATPSLAFYDSGFALITLAADDLVEISISVGATGGGIISAQLSLAKVAP